jgi:hypothetical protein
MSIRFRSFLDHSRHAEYAGPDEFELVLSAVQAVAQPNAPDDVTVLVLSSQYNGLIKRTFVSKHV